MGIIVPTRRKLLFLMETEEDFTPIPPDHNRVAARALVLAAVCCRGLIEKDSEKAGAETTPLGKLDRKATIDASWRSEGMVVLAWALHNAQLPGVQAQCEPSDVANEMGFLGERENTLLHSPPSARRGRNCEVGRRLFDTSLAADTVLAKARIDGFHHICF